jgi:predicted amidohydrolase
MLIVSQAQPRRKLRFIGNQILLCAQTGVSAEVKTMKIAVVQLEIEDTLDRNRDKLLQFIGLAKEEGCEVVIFPESSLYWSDIALHEPSKAELDAAISQIAQKAKSESIYVIFSSQNKTNDRGKYIRGRGKYVNYGIVYASDGKRLIYYKKNSEVPKTFYVHGVPFNIVVCSDRGYLEHSDLPCLTQGSKVIIDTSGGHGGDDGRASLRRIRYRPWAYRTNAFVIVCNPPHFDTDYMGNSPWGGGSAIIRPDGTVQAGLMYEKDVMIVEDIDLFLATRAEAERRWNHPIFKPFWDMGEKLLHDGKIPSIPAIVPYKSAKREIKIAAAQIACSRNIENNVKKIIERIQKASDQNAHLVVFPELAVTGNIRDDIEMFSQSDMDKALSQIKDEAKAKNICVIVGMPYMVDGKRRNCAFVIGDAGGIKTRYEQLSPNRTDLFQPGSSVKSLWFQLKGVHSIVTIGEDSKWIEMADLAANRGMYLHFHISCETDASDDDAILRKQKNLLMLSYARYGALVNAAAPSGGASMIVSREGGHGKPSPEGIIHYLPYQTSVVKRAGSEESLIYGTRKTSAKNNLDLMSNWRNRNRKSRSQKGWYDWIKSGAALIEH